MIRIAHYGANEIDRYRRVFRVLFDEAADVFHFADERREAVGTHDRVEVYDKRDLLALALRELGYVAARAVQTPLLERKEHQPQTTTQLACERCKPASNLEYRCSTAGVVERAFCKMVTIEMRADDDPLFRLARDLVNDMPALRRNAARIDAQPYLRHAVRASGSDFRATFVR